MKEFSQSNLGFSHKISDPTPAEKSVIMGRLLALRKGQITRECNRLPPLLAKFRQEKQDDSGLVPSSAQSAMKCISLIRQYSEDLRGKADEYSELLLSQPDESSVEENNKKIAAQDKAVEEYLKRIWRKLKKKNQ